jgi:hypothetical protein
MPDSIPSSRGLPGLVLALCAVLLLAGALLAPLQSGAFLLDDLPNLAGLERVHAEPDGAARFVTGGIAGPGGRPVALASFAVQAGDWPYRPGPFKRVNLALHLACGLALFWLWALLARRALPEREAGWLALAVTALWLVHPLQLSSVAYVVQRMTLLAALPMLLGLVAFVKGRERVERAPEDPRGYLLALGGLGAGGLVALASKESGGLILPLALAIDHTLFRAEGASAARWRAVRRWALHLPLALAALGLLTLGAGWLAEGYAGREFTLGERLLSQPRALLDYAWRALLPSRAGLGVFHDDFATSRALLEPWTTLPALAALGLASARRRASAASSRWWRSASPGSPPTTCSNRPSCRSSSTSSTATTWRSPGCSRFRRSPCWRCAAGHGRDRRSRSARCGARPSPGRGMPRRARGAIRSDKPSAGRRSTRVRCAPSRTSPTCARCAATSPAPPPSTASTTRASPTA